MIILTLYKYLIKNIMHLYSFVFVEHQQEGLTDFMVRKHMSTVQYPLNTTWRLFLAEHVSSYYFC